MAKARNDIIGSRAWRQGAGLLLAMLATLAAPAAPATWAQSAGQERYQPERSRADYEAPAASEDGFDYSAQTLRVSVWLDRDEDEVYRRGDEQRIGFQTNEDAYAVVYRIDTDGLVTVLWPRDRLDDGFVFGGHEYRLPGREASALRIDESEGEGFVQAVVSRYPFDLRALEIDFLGDDDARYGFQVAGDPFLAMNEVNYAITGLEDSRDHVIANHTRYYVHRVVDHPRYLCAQCHDGDSLRYDPYEGHCTLQIDYDYGWSNRWYANYGYYPVYCNPVWVYIDPWTWRPWVNFWYDPWYVCAPWQGWRGAYWDCYTWYDSPYYRGNCGSRWDGGDRRYRPLNRHGESVAVRKAHEYDTVSRQVARSRLEPGEREAMIARRPLAGRSGLRDSGSRDRSDGSPVSVARGDKPATRAVERYPSAGTTRQGGLRIRPDRSGGNAAAGGQPADKPTRRHTAAGGGQESRLTPVKPVVRGQDGATPRPGSGSVRQGDGGANRDADRDGVRALNPRQRGTRVWNGTTDRGTRPERPARTRQNEDSRARDESAAPTQRPQREDGNSDGRAVEPRRGGPADGGRREEVAPGSEAGNRRTGDSRRESREAPRSVRETPRQGRESAPAPARQEPARRSEPPRSRDSGNRDSGKANDSSADDKPAEAPARRAPAGGRK